MHEYHPMNAEVLLEQGLVRFTCPRCQHCVNVDTTTGNFSVVNAGDRRAYHNGSTFDRLGAPLAIDLATDESGKSALH
jgi:hypothetical protein